jgi:hypothetical protein
MNENILLQSHPLSGFAKVTAFALKLRRRAARQLGRAAMNSDLMGSYCGFSGGYLADQQAVEPR